MRVLQIVLLIPLLMLTACKTAIEHVFYEHDAPVFEIPDGPFAKIDQKYRHAAKGSTITLVGSKSYDLEDKNLTYHWKLLEKPDNSETSLVQDNDSVKLHIDRDGSYKIQLIVNNGNASSHPFTAIVSTKEQELPRVNFIALGDFGTGKEKQYAVAEGIRQVCQQKRCDFAIGLGDNIYPEGPTTVDDPQFIDKFEKPYQNINLPFYMVQGNHDNSGYNAGDGGYNKRGELQIAYSREMTLKLDSKSNREKLGRQLNKWQQPGRYYEIPAPAEEMINQPLVSFLAIDSTALTSFHDPISEYDLKEYSKKQAKWINSTLHNSTAQWHIAFAHHPLVSNGEHGNAGNYNNGSVLNDHYLAKRATGEYFRDFFEENLCNRVDIFIAGHDHSLQLLKPVSRCGKTRFIVSGAGAKTTGIRSLPTNEAAWQEGDKTGFFYLSIRNNTMTIEAYTVDDQGVAVMAHREMITQ